MQSESGGGCDGGGKGALVQEDKSGTLGTGNDQTIFCYGISAYESNAMKSSNPKSGVYVADTSRTLDLNGGNPACNQGGMAVVCAGFKLGNSEQARSIGYAEEQSPTLNAECGGNKPAVVALDMTHACDVIRECGEVVPSLQARMGTGGNQVPLTYQEVTGTLSPGAHAGSYNGQDAYNDINVEIKPDDYYYFKLQRRYGPDWWLIGQNPPPENSTRSEWSETALGRISCRDIAKFVEWARIDGGGSKIVEISAISGSFDLLREIKTLLLNPGIARAMAEQWGGAIRGE